MTSEIQHVPVPCKMKVIERSYRTEPGWRLATFQEAKQNHEVIKQRGLLKGRERARLLDGWISRGHDGPQIGDDFERFLGYMLVIQIQPSSNYSSGTSDPAKSIYEDVKLSLKGKEVALLLCAYDWNYEVLYWLLSSWENRDSLNSLDMGEGNKLKRNGTTFVEMNQMVCNLGKILGEEGFASQKAAKKRLSGDSMKEVMLGMGKSCWAKISQEHKKILGEIFLEKIDEFISNIIFQCSDLFQKFTSNGDTPDVIWNFFWYYISCNVIASIADISFSLLIKELNSEKCQARSQRDFIMSTAILHYILEYEMGEGKRILAQACKDAAADDRRSFNNTLQNRSTASYDKNEEYNVLNKILIYAARDGDRFLVNKVLEWGAQPQANLGPDQQNMALRYAIRSNYNDIVGSLFDYCLSREEFANAKNEEGMTALHLACYHADLDMCEMVLKYGGRPEVQDEKGCLPLHYAVQNYNADIVRILFDKCHWKEQLANAADHEGMTLLHWACLYPDVSVCKMVLEYGGNPDVRDNRGRLPLHYAVDGTYADRKEIASSLFDKCRSKAELANAKDKEGSTALHLACRSADVSVCEMVLGYGRRLDLLDDRHRLPLHYAVERCNEDIVDVLIGVGNSDALQNQHVSKLDPKRAEMVTLKDKDEVTPLDIAVNKYMIKIMVKLLSVSQQLLETYIDKVDSSKLLREFASEGNLEAVEKLLEKGADTLACDESKRTALHHASMCENDYNACKVAELMLAKCTRKEEEEEWVVKEDANGQTAVYLAAMSGHEGLCDFFCEISKSKLQLKDADGPGLVYDFVKRGQHDNPKILWSLLGVIDSGRRESMIDHSGLTLLHVAASNGKKYIADALLKGSNNSRVYVRTPDVLGQTALHKAAKGGHADTVKVLLYWGAHPLLERDSNGQTALHCAVQSKSEDQTTAIVKLLLNKCTSNEMKLLLLWASAAGLGTADQDLSDSPLKNFLLKEKKDITAKVEKENNLLRTAACLGDVEMTKELLTRGAQIGDIQDQDWLKKLKSKERHNVVTVYKQIQRIAEQGNDQPTISDNLGRMDFANGLAALLLNPYLKPPITVGISGTWGMGKSSLMIQTECILLKTAAQLALMPSKMTSSSFPGIHISKLSKQGSHKYEEIKKTVDSLNNDKSLLTLKNKIIKWWANIKNKKDTNAKEEDSLYKILNEYEVKHHRLYKLLAAMESSYMFKSNDQQSESKIDSSTEGNVPAILTIRYNAWRYRNESEALAGMAVEITEGMEGIMTEAQWLSTCLRNTWRKQKQVIWIEIIFPCLLAVLLAFTFTWIVWLLLDKYKIKESVELKYASFPLTVVIMVWTMVKKVMSTVNPVSAQLMNYIKLPDHAENLGYQERVISDITFLKKEMSKKPYRLCIAASYMWHCIKRSYIISLLFLKNHEEILASSIPSANLRTVVFVDDLDRCQESVILQVLAAINLVLAVCEINVVLGMDKDLIQRAIMKNYGDESSKNSSKLADKYLQKIIQLPLDLPDPSEVQSKEFLDRHLGVFQKQSKEGYSESKIEAEDDYVPEIETAYLDLFSPFKQSVGYVPDFTKILDSATPIPETTEPLQGTESADRQDIAIDVQYASGTNGSNSQQTSPVETNTKIDAPEEENGAEGDQSLSSLIPIKQLLFMTYSKGEQNVFDFFQKMATDIRKLPREWKRLLNYHRLVWNIFLINNEAKDLGGWQVQLITWIFICWEWEESINILIENWDKLRALPTHEDEPSLRMIVDHFIKNERCIIVDDKSEKSKGLENSVNKDRTPHNSTEDKKEDGASKNEENPVSSTSDVGKEKSKEVVTEGVISEKNIIYELDSLKKEVKEQSYRILKLQEELTAQVDSIVKQREVQGNEKSAKDKKLKLKSWRRLKFALQRYDVSMKGIQAFQRFRFYCVAGHLPWPFPKKRIADI